MHPPEQIEAANRLLEGQTDLPTDELLGVVQYDRVPDLLALRVPLDLAIEGRALARLGVRVVRPDGVHLDIGPVGRHEVLVDVRAGLAYSRLRRVDAAAAADLGDFISGAKWLQRFTCTLLLVVGFFKSYTRVFGWGTVYTICWLCRGAIGVGTLQ